MSEKKDRKGKRRCSSKTPCNSEGSKHIGMDMCSVKLQANTKEIEESNLPTKRLKCSCSSLTNNIIDYQSIFQSDFSLKQFVSITHPYQIMQVQNEIWCGCIHEIRVFNLECKEVRRITHKKTKDLRGFTVTSKDVFIATCKKGLHNLNLDGEYNKKIIKGRFADVVAHSDNIYALEHAKNQILILLKSKDDYIVQRSISIKQDLFKSKYMFVSACDRLWVCERGGDSCIYYSSWDGNCIYILDNSGALQKNIVSYMKRPSICRIDNTGNILVTSITDQRIEIYSAEGEWSKMKLIDCHDIFESPIDALIDHEGNVWVADHDGKLFKFSVSTTSSKNIEGPTEGPPFILNQNPQQPC